MDLNVGNVTGVVNATGGSINVESTSSDFQMGNLSVTGDPTFVINGNYTITGSEATSGNPLIIVASGSILSNTGANINTSSSTGNGGNVTLVNGANATDADGFVTITGRSTHMAVTSTSLATRSAPSTPPAPAATAQAERSLWFHSMW